MHASALAQHPRCRSFLEAAVRPDESNVRVPDLTVSCEAIGREDRFLRSPLLIIEILSPSNVSATWDAVALYSAMPSVREILVLHVAEVRADLLVRSSDGTWPDSPAALTAGDTVALDSMDFAAPLAAFYQTTEAGVGDYPSDRQ